MKTFDPTQLVSTRWRELVTPEGVGIKLEVATAARRASAFLIDLTIILVIGFIGVFVGSFFALVSDGIASAIMVISIFILVNFYFPGFEAWKGGMTPGKMVTRIRVVDRQGAALSLRAVVTRNFMRDLEFWLPLKFLVVARLFPQSLPQWSIAFAVLWSLALILFPIFNSHRLRLGDLIAGTMVVEYPRINLLPDLAVESTGKKHKQHDIEFSQEQLEIYGVYELQVLEDILRRKGKANSSTLRGAADKISAKIDWQSSSRVSPRVFLEAFYRAQRARLEKQMSLGKKKLSKFDD